MSRSLNILVRADIHCGPIILDVHGSLSVDSCPELIRVIERAATLDGCTAICVDVTGCSDIDDQARTELEDYISERNVSFLASPCIGLVARKTAERHQPHSNADISRPTKVGVGAQ